MNAVTKTLSEGYNATKRALSGTPPNEAYLRWDSQGTEEIKSDEGANLSRLRER